MRNSSLLRTYGNLFSCSSVFVDQVCSSSSLAGLRQDRKSPRVILVGVMQINEDVLHGLCPTTVVDRFLVMPHSWWCTLSNVYPGFAVNTNDQERRMSLRLTRPRPIRHTGSLAKYRSSRDVVWCRRICGNAKYFDQEPSCIHEGLKLVVLFPVHNC